MIWTLQDVLHECVHLRHVHLQPHGFSDLHLEWKLLQCVATMQHLRVLYWDCSLRGRRATSMVKSHCSFFSDDFVREICSAASRGLQLLELHVVDIDSATKWELPPSLKYLGVRST